MRFWNWRAHIILTLKFAAKNTAMPAASCDLLDALPPNNALYRDLVCQNDLSAGFNLYKMNSFIFNAIIRFILNASKVLAATCPNRKFTIKSV